MSADSNYAYCTLRPLFTEMATSNAITIRNYVRGTGLTGSSTVTYTGDIETAAAGFLGAMDDTGRYDKSFASLDFAWRLIGDQ